MRLKEVMTDLCERFGLSPADPGPIGTLRNGGMARPVITYPPASKFR